MGTPDEAALAAARALLAEQADAVKGDPSAAGIFGDVAGASQPPQPMDLSAARPTEIDAEELLAKLQAQSAAQQAQIDALLAAAKAAEPAPPEPPDKMPRLSESASSEVRHAFALTHERLLAIEAHLGLE